LQAFQPTAARVTGVIDGITCAPWHGQLRRRPPMNKWACNIS